MVFKQKKIRVTATLLIYISSVFLQSLSSLFEARAAEVNIPHVNIITILVDDQIYNELKDDIQRYTTSYIQKEIPESKALVMPLNLQNIDAPDIYRMMENIYFEGLENVNSTLLGLILIGNIPLPVINQEGYVFPSIYPYVDFERQKYVRDEAEQYFVPNGNPDGQAEIRHGIINYDYDQDLKAYKEFFKKIKTYQQNPSKFIGEQVRYEDFIASKQGFLEDNLQYYQNKTIFAEDIGYHRYTPLMLKTVQGKQNASAEATVKDLSDILVKNGSSTELESSLPDQDTAGISTKIVEKTIRESYLIDYPNLFSSQNGIVRRDNVLAGGRRVDEYKDSEGQSQLKAKVDSSSNSILIKDTLNIGNDSIKGLLTNFNDLLERTVDNKILKEKYDMDIVIPTEYRNKYHMRRRYWIGWLLLPIFIPQEKRFNTTYKVYYFGKEAKLINSAQELSIYRGSFRNLTSLSGINYSTLPSSNINPAKSTGDPTDLKNKSIGGSYDIFSTQVEANRGYNFNNMQVELDLYEKVKTFQYRGVVCTKPFKICGKEIKAFCFQRGYRGKEIKMKEGEPYGGDKEGICNPSLYKLYELDPKKFEKFKDAIKDCEDINHFSTRQRGGGSPLNIDFTGMANGEYNLTSFNGKDARLSIFDMAGSKALTSSQPAANSYKAFQTYGSPTATQRMYKDTASGLPFGFVVTAGEKKATYQVDEVFPTDHEKKFSNLDFFKTVTNGKSRKLSTKDKTFTLHRKGNNSKRNDIVEEKYNYKVISSIVKNTSITPEEINGRNTTKYGTGSKLKNYYDNIWGGIEGTTAGISFTTNSSGEIITGDILLDGENIINEMMSGENGFDTLESLIDQLSGCFSGYINNNMLTCNGVNDSNLKNCINGVIDYTDPETQSKEINSLSGDDAVYTSSTGLYQQALDVKGQFNAFYDYIENINGENLLAILKDDIKVKEQAVFAAGKTLDAKLERISTIYSGLSQLTSGYDNVIALYKSGYNTINQKKEEIVSALKKIDKRIGEFKGNAACIPTKEYHPEGWTELLSAMERFFKTESLMCPRNIDGECKDGDEPITILETLGINDFSKAEFKKVIETNPIIFSGENDEELISRSIRKFFDTMFKVNPADTLRLAQHPGEDIPEKIPGLNLLTPDRPIDSPRYTTFQGINAQEIKFIYPNLYKVEVFKTGGSNNQLILKTIPEIRSALETYLQNKVNEYNAILSATKATTANAKAYNELQDMGFTRATPIGRTYQGHLFTYNDLLQALGGTGQLQVIAELLYYQSLSNKERPYNDNISTDLQNIRDTFDINNKVEYTFGEYLKENNNKHALVLPGYKTGGYEVGYINSDGKDLIFPTEMPTFVETAEKKKKEKKEKMPEVVDDDKYGETTKAIQNKCGIPADGSVLIFDIKKMNSPRLKAFLCWIEEMKKSPVKVKIDFAESLGPTIFDKEGMKDHLGTPFKQRNTAIQEYGNDRSDLVNKDQDTSSRITELDISIETQNQQIINSTASPEVIRKKLSDYYSRVKIFNERNILSERNNSSLLTITANQDVGPVKIEISGTGDSCLIIDRKNLCQSPNIRTETFNPQTHPKTGLLITLPDDWKAGSNLLSIKICTPTASSKDCVTKTQKITINPGILDTITIKPERTGDNSTVGGMMTVFEVKAFDQKKNLVDRSTETYTITADTGQFLHEGRYTTGFKVNNFKNLKFYYQAPENSINNSKATIQALSDTGRVMTERKQTLLEGFPQVSYGTYDSNGKQISKNLDKKTSTFTGNITLTLPPTDTTHFIDNKGIRQLNRTFNQTGLQRLDINILDKNNKLIKVDSKVTVYNKDNLVNIGTIAGKTVSSGGNQYTGYFLQKTSQFTLTGGTLTVYFYPNKKSGTAQIDITIPGLQTFTLYVQINPARAEILEIIPEKELITIQDSIQATIKVKDVRGNPVNQTTSIALESNKILTIPSKNLTITGGERKIGITGENGGLGYLVGEIQTNNMYDTQPAIARVSINKTLTPTTGLNVLYLNYFGNDRGNQRGYFSDNKKYIENIMKDSNKTIATTTQLISENNIKEMIRKIEKGLQIQNFRYLPTTLTLNTTSLNVNIQEVATIQKNNITPIKRRQVNNEIMISEIIKKQKPGNYAFFIPNNEEYILTGNSIYADGQKVGDLNSTDFSFVLSMSVGELGYQIREIRSNQTNMQYGYAIFSLPTLEITKTDINLLNDKYLIASTFSKGSTKHLDAIGIFDPDNFLELNRVYPSIQDSHERDESIGFRGDFKNMTLFAQGERVGEASMKFGSELLINLGDPLLKKYTNNKTIKGTKFDGGLGTAVFTDPSKTIYTSKIIDFNNDGINDLIVVYTDGTVKIAKNYGSEPNFKNLEDLLLLAINIKEVYIGDIDGNQYQDIVILTQNNQLRGYLNGYKNPHGSQNPNGTFDVDGYPICLNTNVELGKISEHPEQLDGIDQIFLEDMDNDGKLDIITYDKAGFVKIFYGGSTKVGSSGEWPNYLSRERTGCDEERYERQKNTTKEVTRVGIQIDDTIKVTDNSMIHEYGLKIPEGQITPENIGPNSIVDENTVIPKEILEKLEDPKAMMESMKDDPSQIFGMLGPDLFDMNAMSEFLLGQLFKYQTLTLSTPLQDHDPKNEKNEYVFIPISYLESSDGIQVYKEYKDLNGGILQKGDKVHVKVTIKASKNFRGTFGDKIQGPRVVSYSGNVPNLIGINQPNTKILLEKNNDFTYLLDNIQLTTGQTLEYSYTLTYTEASTQSITLEDINGEIYDKDTPSIKAIKADGLLDIKLQPQGGCIKYMKTFINTNNSKEKEPPKEKNREYTMVDINLQKLIDEYTKDAEEQQKEATKELSKITDIAKPGANRHETMEDLPGISTSNINIQDILGGGGLNLGLDFLGGIVDQIQNVLDEVTAGLCKGFSFGGNNSCPGLPIPFNQAFLAPGAYHLFGCIPLPPVTETLGKGIPMISFPGSLQIGPVPVPLPQFFGIGPGLQSPTDAASPETFLAAPGGPLPIQSMIRVYIAPTLTLQIGIAICLGPYSTAGLSFPDPIGSIAGNCFVMAIKPQCPKKANNPSAQDNPNETFKPWINNLYEGCSLSPKGSASTKTGFGSSPLKLTVNTDKGVPAPYIPDGVGILGFIDLDIDTIGGEDGGGVSIGGIKIEGGAKNIKNQIRDGLQQGLRKIIIDNWLDPQIRYIINNFTKMHIEIKRPDLGTLLNEAIILGKIIEQVGDMGKKKEEKPKPLPKEYPENFSKWDIAKDKMSSSSMFNGVNDAIANPFEQLSVLFNQSNILNIQTKNLTVKIPMIYGEDINSYELYLKQRVNENINIAEKWIEMLTGVIYLCVPEADKSLPRQTNLKNARDQNKLSPTCQEAISKILKIIQDLENMLDRINENILILGEYRNLIFDLYEWVHVIDRYMAEISALINNFLGYLSYWMTTNANRYEGYIDAIILIMNTIKTYQIIIDFFVNRTMKCSTCTQDTNDQFSCKLSLLCNALNGLLPILQIPNFKIPDLTIDFSDLNIGMDILLPVFNFQPVKIDLPSIPNLPTPPLVQLNIPNINLPQIPELPRPPQLPELPSFIPNITLELPVLPPAPKIPALPNTFEVILNIAEKIGKIICTIKQGFGLVGEKSVKAKIEQITQRTYEVKWIDTIMNLSNFQLKLPKMQGFDYEIIATTNLQFSFSSIYDFLDNITSTINKISTATTTLASDAIKKGEQAVNDGVEQGLGAIENLQLGKNSTELEYKEYPEAKQRLEEGIANFKNISNDQQITNSLKSIEKTINQKNQVAANQQGILETQDEVTSLINTQQERIQSSKEILAQQDRNKFIDQIDQDQNKPTIKEEQLAFNINLFNLDQQTKNRILSLENPYLLLLDNKKAFVDGFLQEFNANTAQELQVSEAFYSQTKNNLQQLQTQIAGLYKTLQPQYQTFLTNNQMETSKKTLTAGGGSTSPNQAVTSIDPASYTKGIYIPTENRELTKALYSDKNAEIINKRYQLIDINKDKTEDVLLWDDHSVYIKYGKQDSLFYTSGKPHDKQYYNKFYVAKLSTIPSAKTYLTFDKDTNLKIADQHFEVKNFLTQGQTFDNISFGRRKSNESSVYAYLIKLTDRVDYSPEKQDLTDTDNTNNIIKKNRYLLVLPQSSSFSNLKIELPTAKNSTTINTIENFLDRDEGYKKEIAEIRYFSPDADNISTSIENIPRMRKYARITTLRKEGDTLKISAPRSNQIVAGRQILGDDQGPEGIAKLKRLKINNEIVSEGDGLEGFVGTHYTIEVEREDNVELASMQIEYNGIITEKKAPPRSLTGSISTNLLFYTEAKNDTFIFHAQDKQGNNTSKEVVLSISIPEIEITDIAQTTSGAVITAELSQDIDEGTVSFERNRNKIRDTLIATENGKKIEQYPLKPRLSEIKAQYYDMNENIGLFAKNGDLIGEIDPKTGEITIKDDYKSTIEIRVEITMSPQVHIYDKKLQKVLFSIHLPTEKVGEITAPGYEISPIQQDMGVFNNGKVIQKNGTNVLFVGPQGQLYSEKGISGTYHYNASKQEIEYHLQENTTNNTIKIPLKVQPFQKK